MNKMNTYNNVVAGERYEFSSYNNVYRGTKFWEYFIEADATNTHDYLLKVCYGKKGTNGQTRFIHAGSYASCLALGQSKAKLKVKAGYATVPWPMKGGVSLPPPAQSAPFSVTDWEKKLKLAANTLKNYVPAGMECEIIVTAIFPHEVVQSKA